MGEKFEDELIQSMREARAMSRDFKKMRADVMSRFKKTLAHLGKEGDSGLGG